MSYTHDDKTHLQKIKNSLDKLDLENYINETNPR